ncbi:hypothetical protein KVT40_007194 [Elsinoe batatas]|uniref:Uncharacterized protein n=1 Tax=Elsinoe batatas TaxID=2601811 RepID=A0A8K0KZH4_9PEZI|nr:hypothetical protein KVT40_007194 [Elsinoe batatas]
MAPQKWSSENHTGPIPSFTTPFHLPIPPKTDIWALPPSHDVFTAPVLHTTLSHSSFSLLRATITAPWKHQYDQGGILISIVSASGPRRWVKCGVEMLDGTPRVGTVARDNWADWSLHPVVHSDGRTATVEFVNEVGKALWVYLIGEDRKRYPLREVAWWAGLKGETELQVGVYGAAPGEEGGLEVEFSGVQVNGEGK